MRRDLTVLCGLASNRCRQRTSLEGGALSGIAERPCDEDDCPYIATEMDEQGNSWCSEHLRENDGLDEAKA